MLRSPLIPALALSFGLVVSGCSGDDQPGTPELNTPPSSRTGTTEEARTACEADVTVEGNVRRAWTGEGFVITENRSGPALYRAQDGPVTLTVYGPEEDRKAYAVVNAKGENYTTQPDEGTVEADPGGGSAKVESPASGFGGRSVDVTASLSC